MKVEQIDENEYLSIIKEKNIEIPIWCDEEALEYYNSKELIKILKNNEILAIFLIPLDKNAVRREYRYFPYCMPIILSKLNNFRQKELYKAIFNYIFNKYNYTFIPLHPDFKMISSISSQKGFVEMRHTHILYEKLKMENISSKLRNHIKSAKKNVNIVIDNDYYNFDFFEAIKGDEKEQIKRSSLTKKLIDRNKGFFVKAIYNSEVVAGLAIIYDDKWAYLLHSYQKQKIRGIVPLMIYEGTKKVFEELNLKCFDFEGSVIDDIDDFFSGFDANIMTYPYIIQSNDDEKFYELLNRSINIKGRVKMINENNNNND